MTGNDSDYQTIIGGPVREEKFGLGLGVVVNGERETRSGKRERGIMMGS